MATPLAETIAREYGTPAVVIDMDKVEANIARVQAQCDAQGLANRPHIKTHKSPELAKLQVAAGAKGITCQKIGEAEVMAAAGLDDILISYNLLGEEKMNRLGRLLETVSVTVAADNATVVGDLPKARRWRGVRSASSSNATRAASAPASRRRRSHRARQARRRLPGLTFRGFMMYPTEDGWPEAQKFLDTALAGIRLEGLDAEIISTGGSPNMKNIGKLKGATEHRPGTYIYNDRMQVEVGVATLDDCALTVYSTVVSRAGADRGILDAGSKTLTADPGGGLDGYGLILEHPEARIAKFAEEHGFLDLSKCNERPKVGDIVRVSCRTMSASSSTWSTRW